MRTGLRSRLLTAALSALVIIAVSTFVAKAPNASAQDDAAQDDRYLEMLLAADLGIANPAVAELKESLSQADLTQLISDALTETTTPGLGPDCGGIVVSVDADGGLVDAALAVPNGVVIDLFPEADRGSAVFSEDNPFTVVDTIAYAGSIDAGTNDPISVAWDITSAGVPIAGGSATGADTEEAGVIKVRDQAPLGRYAMPLGVFPVEGTLQTSGDGSCAGSGWIVIEGGNPATSRAGLAAGALTLTGAAGLFINARPQRARNKKDQQ